MIEEYKNFEVTDDYIKKYFSQKEISDPDFRNVTNFFKVKSWADWEVNLTVENVLDSPLS